MANTPRCGRTRIRAPCAWPRATAPSSRTRQACRRASRGLLLMDEFSHLVDGDRGQEAQEGEEEEEEQRNRAAEDDPVPTRGNEQAPGRRQEVAMHALHDDHHALEPHAELHEETEREE